MAGRGVHSGRQEDERLEVGLRGLAWFGRFGQFAVEEANQPHRRSARIEHTEMKLVVGDDIKALADADQAARRAEEGLAPRMAGGVDVERVQAVKGDGRSFTHLYPSLKLDSRPAATILLGPEVSGTRSEA